MEFTHKVYECLKSAEVVDGYEQFSTDWLKNHKGTMSYLICKNRDMSLNAQINCLKNIHAKINEISNKDLKMNDFFSKNLLYLNQAKDLLDNNIQTKFKFGLKIIHQLSNSQFIQ